MEARENSMSCFGYIQDVTGEWFCGALQGVRCDGMNTKCKFYKTPEQYRDRPKTSGNEYHFTLVIDGRKHGNYESMAEIDQYLTRYYLDHQEDEDARAETFKGEYMAVFENHNIRILEGEWSKT